MHLVRRRYGSFIAFVVCNEQGEKTFTGVLHDVQKNTVDHSSYYEQLLFSDQLLFSHAIKHSIQKKFEARTQREEKRGAQ